MRERDIEAYLRDSVKATGGKAYKWTSPGNAGVPDRIVIYPGNRIYFVELKASGQKPRPLQIKQMDDLRKLGCLTCWLDSKEGVDSFIERVMEDSAL